MNRRDLFMGVGAAALSPRTSWADAHDPAFLSAAQAPDGRYHLCGLDESGSVLFNIPLPDRGHAAAAHPQRPEAVAFARRPGWFAVVLDCSTGQETARLRLPRDRHFYGHGTFSPDGSILFTTENDLDTLDGRIGMWDATNGYTRIGDIPSGGVGPHDIKRLPGSDTLVVANGGIATHPDSGRTPLNLATMRPNLAYVSQNGDVTEIVELDIDLRQNSIRHLDVRADGLVAAGMQWNGPDGIHPALTLLHGVGAVPRLLRAPMADHRRLSGYVGSISFDSSGSQVAVTSPRGGEVQIFGVADGGFLTQIRASDVCGLTKSQLGQFLTTSGEGHVAVVDQGVISHRSISEWSWDNHIVALV